MSEKMKSINFMQKFIILIAIIFFIFISVVIINTFSWHHAEIWAKEYAAMLSASGILIAAALATATVQKSIQSTNDIEENRKYNDLLASRLYFASTMKGLSDILIKYVTVLDSLNLPGTYLPINGTPVSLAPIEAQINEINELLKDYIKLINDKNLPNTLYKIRDNELQSIRNLIILKNKIYSLRSILSILISSGKITIYQLASIREYLNNISMQAEELRLNINQNDGL